MKNRESNAEKNKVQNKIILGSIVFLLLATSLIWTYYSYLRPLNKVYISSDTSQKAKVGEQKEIPIIIDTKDESINALEVYLSFDPSIIKVESIAVNNSFIKIWLDNQPSFSNENGEISFAGGIPNPGYSGKGEIGSIQVIRLKPGPTELTFSPKSRILKNDGKGSYLPIRFDPIKIGE